MAQRHGAEAKRARFRRPAPTRSHGPGCRAVGACVALGCSLLVRQAAADGSLRLGVEWEKLAGLLPPEGVTPDPFWRSDAGRELVKAATRPQSPALLHGTGGLGRWSVVARDWDAARSLIGRLAATDEVKPGRSRRMVVLRGRLLEGPITPFAQLGLGQWRFDPDIPAMPRKALVAGQLGIGVEYVIANWVSVAFVADCTLLDPVRLEASNPQPHEEPDVPSRSRDDRWIHPPALWSSFLATRARF